MNYKFGKYEISNGYLYILISIIALIAYSSLGALGKLIVFPLVFFLVLKNDFNYFPALIIQTVYGDFTVYVILLACIFLVIRYFKVLKDYKLSWTFIPLLILSIYIIGHLLYKLFILDIPLLIAIYQYNAFLGIFPFFMGVLYAKQLTKSNIKPVLFILFCIFIYGGYFKGMAAIFFSIPFVFAYSVYNLSILSGKTNLNKILNLLLFTITLLMSISFFSTFTLIFTSLFTTLMVFFYFRKNNLGIKITISLIPFIVVFAFMAYAILNYEAKSVGYEFEGGITLSNFSERARAKAFEDRAPFWSGALKGIIEQGNLLIPVEVPVVEATIEGRTNEVAFGAHNLFLDILNSFGIIVGMAIIIIFISLSIKASGVLRKCNVQPVFVIMACLVTVISSVGSMDGAFPLLSGFSFLLMGISGLCYGLSCKYERD
jgi:hypothetical protein